MDELELWDLITTTMVHNLAELHADAARAADLSSRHSATHQHQESWKKAIQRATTMAPKYEASLRRRDAERPQ